MGEVLGLLLGALFWPWLFGKFCRVIGQQPSAAAWTGYTLAVVIAAAIAGATGFPATNVGLFALFGLGWTLWLSRSQPTSAKVDEAEADDPALHALIDSLETGKSKPLARKAARPALTIAGEQKPAAAAPQAEATGEPVARTCLGCGERNDADAAHCVACGASLNERVCTGCAQVNVAKARFCKRCGSELLRV